MFKKIAKTLILLILLNGYFLAFGQEAYWQQHVDYNIEVSLNDTNHTLDGFEKIVYSNNSPDTLYTLYFHLWPNAYGDNKTAYAQQQIRLRKDQFYFSHQDNYGFIENVHFIDNKDSLSYRYIQEDICEVKLKKPLSPGGKVTLKIPFRVWLPHTFSRLGHVGQSYQITQWYPKPAVYDKNGWNYMPYLDEGEFYSEFGSFRVTIKVPSNYVVAATGVLQNPEEKKWLKKREGGQDIAYNTYIPSSGKIKAITFEQDSIHDFAWFADKTYNLLSDSVELPSGKVVDVYFYYHSNYITSPLIKEKAINDLKAALYYYSKWVGEYPYESATAVTGPLGAGGGMEYPMITITDPFAIIHEVGHNWFYGILGSNERSYGWMDEGLNTFTEERVFDAVNRSRYEGLIKTDTSDKKSKTKFELLQNGNALSYWALSSRNMDQPVQLHSNKYYEFNYGVSLYMKPPAFLNYLKSYLGDSLFDNCMRGYYEQWKFKHPQPEDIKTSFEKTSGKDLSWFFNDLFKGTPKADVAIKSLKMNDNNSIFTLKNKGDFPFPVLLKLYNQQDQVIYSQWVDPFDDEITIELTYTDFEYAKINEIANHLDIVRNNDFIKSSGIKKMKKIHFDMMLSEDNPEACEASIITSMGLNKTDGYMIGLGLHNTSFISKKLEYFIAPMYGIGSGKLTGIAGLNLKLNGNNEFTRTHIRTNFMTFANWNKTQLNLKHSYQGNLFNKVFNYELEMDNFRVMDASISSFKYEMIGHTLAYKLWFRDALNKIEVTSTVEYLSRINHYDSSVVAPASYYENAALRYSLTASYERNYWKGNWASLRAFAGSYYYMGSHDFQYGLSGAMDYARNYYMYDRTSSGLEGGKNQTNGESGGMKSFVDFTAQTLISTNFSVDIPKTPLKVFADYANADNINFWDAGLTFKLIPEVTEVYLPIAGSAFSSSNNLPDGIQDFYENIRILFKWKIEPIEYKARKKFL